MKSTTITYDLKGYMIVTAPTKEQCDERMAEFISTVNDHADVYLNVLGQQEEQPEVCRD